jgi:hypothetical protein
MHNARRTSMTKRLEIVMLRDDYIVLDLQKHGGDRPRLPSDIIKRQHLGLQFLGDKRQLTLVL